MSNATLSQTIRRISEAADPIKAIISEIGQDVINGYTVLGNDVLLGTYIRPNVTPGGIIMTEQTMDEDRFQGKAGLVLKMGPTAFKYDKSGAYYSEFVDEDGNFVDRPKLHTWAVYRPSDAWEVALGHARPDLAKGARTLASCRLIDSRNIRGFIQNPQWIW